MPLFAAQKAGTVDLHVTREHGYVAAVAVATILVTNLYMPIMVGAARKRCARGAGGGRGSRVGGMDGRRAASRLGTASSQPGAPTTPSLFPHHSYKIAYPAAYGPVGTSDGDAFNCVQR